MYQSEKKQIDGFTTYFSEKIKYPFSFGQSIFVPASLHGEKLQIVFLHEKAHIRFGHTIDVLGFELLKIFGWFNPFYFLIERELRQAHEFSADEQVLATGTNISAYCDTLLSCALAGMNVPVNYFTGSQIKTRIQMMHKSKNKKSSLLLMALAFTFIGSGVFFSPRLMGQNPSIQIENEFDKLPEFPGGQMEMVRFIGNNLIYPQTAIESNIEGKVIVEFTVSTDGKIKNIQVKRGIGYGCDEAAMRVVEKMPDWIPAEKDGKKVAALMVLPIKFALQ
ncbi:MAG: M56 family metallopeptidase [Flavobacteriales bacterium]|nr:M56 family metallopeptidase [Flavobacteriales bacterium]